MKNLQICKKTAFAVLATVLLAVATASVARARPESPEPNPEYQYVGLDRTLARVNVATGQVWVLLHDQTPGLALSAAPRQRGWRWQAVRLDGDAPAPASSPRHPGEAP